jgi:hypothetical protein
MTYVRFAQMLPTRPVSPIATALAGTSVRSLRRSSGLADRRRCRLTWQAVPLLETVHLRGCSKVKGPPIVEDLNCGRILSKLRPNPRL